MNLYQTKCNWSRSFIFALHFPPLSLESEYFVQLHHQRRVYWFSFTRFFEIISCCVIFPSIHELCMSFDDNKRIQLHATINIDERGIKLSIKSIFNAMQYFIYIRYRNDHSKWRKIEFWWICCNIKLLQLQSSLQYGILHTGWMK